MMSAICLAFIIFLLKSLFVTNKVVSLQKEKGLLNTAPDCIFGGKGSKDLYFFSPFVTLLLSDMLCKIHSPQSI